MFQLTRFTPREREKLLARARQAPLSSPNLVTLIDGPVGMSPKGFTHDFTRTEIGRGLDVFAAARRCLQSWEPFDLGWVQLANDAPRVASGELVAVEAHTALVWSISINRIVETVDTPTRFGFMYATTTLHVEEGQERFLLEFDCQSKSVHYLIEAVSRPRHILARVGFPFSRAMQHRFTRDSHARMRCCALGRSTNSRSAVGDVGDG